MKTAEQWLAADDQAWLDEPASIIERIQREAFAAGHAQAAETLASAIDGHARRLGSQLAVPVPASIPMGLHALARYSRELAGDPAVLESAWKRAAAGLPRARESA